jgi:hypothetical protein
MTGYSWYCGDLRTGRISTQIPVAPGTSWSNVMDDSGTVSCLAALGDPAVQALSLPSAAAPARAFLAVAYDDGQNETFLEGGPVWGHAYDDDKQQLTINAGGLLSYFDHRKVMQVLTAGQSPAVVSAAYSGLSLATIAKRLVQLAATHTGGNLPVVLPADVTVPADAAHQRTYNGYDLAWVGEQLRNLMAVLGGPEISFVPRRTTADSRYIEWVMRAGTETDPLLHQAGSDWVWDGSVPKGGVTSISLAVDGTQMGDEAYVKGSGEASTALIGHAVKTTLTDAGYPLLELEVGGHESVTTLATLNDYATAELASSARTVLSFTVKVARDQAPTVSQYQVGDYVQLIVPTTHPYLTGGGTFRSRIVQRSGDDSTLVTLQLAPVPGSY